MNGNVNKHSNSKRRHIPVCVCCLRNKLHTNSFAKIIIDILHKLWLHYTQAVIYKRMTNYEQTVKALLEHI